jgi:hypothetical protein
LLTGTLADVEPLVGETVATLQLGHGTTLTAVFPDTGESAVLAPGKVVQVGIDPQELCLFDPSTEQALTAA